MQFGHVGLTEVLRRLLWDIFTSSCCFENDETWKKWLLRLLQTVRTKPAAKTKLWEVTSPFALLGPYLCKSEAPLSSYKRGFRSKQRQGRCIDVPIWTRKNSKVRQSLSGGCRSLRGIAQGPLYWCPLTERHFPEATNGRGGPSQIVWKTQTGFVRTVWSGHGLNHEFAKTCDIVSSIWSVSSDH